MKILKRFLILSQIVFGLAFLAIAIGLTYNLDISQTNDLCWGKGFHIAMGGFSFIGLAGSNWGYGYISSKKLKIKLPPSRRLLVDSARFVFMLGLVLILCFVLNWVSPQKPWIEIFGFKHSAEVVATFIVAFTLLIQFVWKTRNEP